MKTNTKVVNIAVVGRKHSSSLPYRNGQQPISNQSTRIQQCLREFDYYNSFIYLLKNGNVCVNF